MPLVGTGSALRPLPEIPREFGRYTLLYRFASGGMADVYLGELTGADGFKKHVAIKIIHEHLTREPQFIDMFIDEAHLAARITHPNVAQVKDLGTTGGRHYLVMEHVNGESLSAFARRTLIPFPICMRIISDAAAGLHAAHELRDEDGALLNVVHRDVSPNNILISYDGTVKLIDFGVAKAKGSLHVSEAGAVKGKFAYMSPEQLSLTPIDRRTDVFALGVVLYEISVRRRLFRANSEAETVGNVMHKTIDPPSALVDDYPPGLEAIVMKALHRVPGERFPTAEDLHVALEHEIVKLGTPVLERDVAQLMREVFADNIAEKEQCLIEAEQAEYTDSVLTLPSYPSLSLGVLGETRTTADGPLATRRRRLRRTTLGAAVAVALAAGGVAALSLWGAERERARTDTDDAAAAVRVAREAKRAPPGRPAAPAPGTAQREPRAPPGAAAGSAARLRRVAAGSAQPSAPARRPPRKIPGRVRRRELVRLQIRASPAKARIRFGARVVPNPFVTSWPRRRGATDVLVSASGHEPRRLRVDLARGGVFEIVLKKTTPPDKKSGMVEPPRKKKLFDDPY